MVRIVVALTWVVAAQLPAATAPEPAGRGTPEGWFSVRLFGAAGDGEADDTAAVQRAIDAAKAVGGTAYLPPGRYRVSSLNLTGCSGLALRGAGTGLNGSVLLAWKSGVDVLDLTGSMHLNLENFQLMHADNDVVQRTAILMAQVPGGRSNAFHFENLYVTGRYSLATVYDYGCPSSDMLNCDFYNYFPDGEAAVMAFTRGNYAGATSAYAQVDEPSAAKGYLNTSDWTVSACELHDLSTQGRKGTRSKLTALRLDNTMQMRWVGGNISGEGGKLIHLTGRNHHITFVGTTLYSEVGFPAGTVFHVADALEALSVTGCVMQAAGSVLRADPGVVLDQLHMTSKPALGPNGLLIDGPGATLKGSLIHCGGLGLRLRTVESTLLIDPGQVTADKDGSTKVQ